MCDTIDPDDMPRTLMQAVRYFADPDVCDRYMREARWGNAPVCVKCGGENVGEIATRRLLKCRDCGSQFSVVAGTIFAESRLPLSAWMVAAWVVANGDAVSSRTIADAMAIRQPTAWMMLNKIRTAIHLAH